MRHNVATFIDTSPDELDRTVNGFINNHDVEVISISTTTTYDPSKESLFFTVSILYRNPPKPKYE